MASLTSLLMCIKMILILLLFFCQGGLLDTFIKVAVSCKTKPPVYVIREAKALLTRVSHDEFRSQLLPAVQKAMLRNPEIILPCLPKVLSGLSLDLSQYALDIAKSITSKRTSGLLFVNGWFYFFGRITLSSIYLELKYKSAI